MTATNSISFIKIKIKIKIKSIFFEKKPTEKEAMKYGALRLLTLVGLFLILAYLLGMFFFSEESIFLIMWKGSKLLVWLLVAIPAVLLFALLGFALVAKTILAFGGKGD